MADAPTAGELVARLEARVSAEELAKVQRYAIEHLDDAQRAHYRSLR